MNQIRSEITFKGCNQEADHGICDNEEELMEKTGENMNTVTIIKDSVNDIDENVNKMEEQLKQWDERLLMMAKSEVACMQARIDLRKRIDVINAKRAVAQTKFDQFRAAGNEKGDIFKADVEGALKDLEAAFNELIK